MIGTGAATGLTDMLILGSLVYFGAVASSPDADCCIDGYPCIFPTIITGPLALVGLAGFSGVAIARHHHRKPLRRYRVRPALAGLQLQI